MSWMPCPDPESSVTSRPQAIAQLIVPRTVDLGGMKVSRVLPSRDARMIGPFIFLDQMGPARLTHERGLDVLPHPHINLATLTYLFDGELIHRDSLGSCQRITPGAVNWMQAGSGIVHSERTGDLVDQTLLGLQTWVALPESAEESNPHFVHHDALAIPQFDDTGVQGRVIAGEAFGEVSPLETASATLCADVALEKGAQLALPEQYVEKAIYILDGEVQAAGDVFSSGRLLVIAPGATVVLRATQNTRLMLFGGEPMDGPRYIWWNFVSSRSERIEQAQEDWLNARFQSIPHDADDFIPLPSQNSAPRRICAGSDRRG